MGAKDAALDPLELVRVVSLAFNCGLMCTVASVSYPLFAWVSPEAFRAYHEAHCRRIQWVVGPSLLCEAMGVLGPLALNPCLINVVMALLSGLGVGLTGLCAVPLHSKLQKECAPTLIARLCRVHAVRCGVWGTNLGLAVCALWLRR